MVIPFLKLLLALLDTAVLCLVSMPTVSTMNAIASYDIELWSDATCPYFHVLLPAMGG